MLHRSVRVNLHSERSGSPTPPMDLFSRTVKFTSSVLRYGSSLTPARVSLSLGTRLLTGPKFYERSERIPLSSEFCTATEFRAGLPVGNLASFGASTYAQGFLGSDTSS